MTQANKYLIKIIGTVTFAVMLLMIALEAAAHGVNVDNSVTHNYYGETGSSSVTEVYRGMDSEEFDKGMAMSAAGDTCVFDYAPGWQGCFGGGWYGSQSAVNGSLVTRIDNFAVRVNLQSDTDFDEQAIGVGGSWHF